MKRILPTLLAALLLAPSAAFGEDIDWPEAIARLTYERTLGTECARLAKQHGDAAQISQAQTGYAKAKAEFDAVIAGLMVVLDQKDDPGELDNLNVRLQRGVYSRIAFCKDVKPLVPSTEGNKGLLDDIVKETVGRVFDAIAALWSYRREDDALKRATIKTQLEAASWPAFGDL